MTEPNTGEQGYLWLLGNIIEGGDERMDRTGTGTRALFGEKLKFHLTAGFPLMTTKKLYWKGIVEELLFFIRGQTDNNILKERGVHIWDEWEKEGGNLGPVYGKQWRDWESISRNMKNVHSRHIGSSFDAHGGRSDLYEDHIDQLANLIKGLRENPFSRYHIVSAWNPAELHLMALPPCHMMFQCFVTKDGELSLQIYQRSCDTFLGVPFNVASYALLTHMLAQQAGLTPGWLTWIGGDTHLYLNHLDQVREQIARVPRAFPQLIMPTEIPKSIEDYEYSDFILENYNPYPPIKAPIAV